MHFPLGTSVLVAEEVGTWLDGEIFSYYVFRCPNFNAQQFTDILVTRRDLKRKCEAAIKELKTQKLALQKYRNKTQTKIWTDKELSQQEQQIETTIKYYQSLKTVRPKRLTTQERQKWISERSFKERRWRFTLPPVPSEESVLYCLGYYIWMQESDVIVEREGKDLLGETYHQERPF